MLERSTSLNRVLFSNDADLIAEATARQQDGVEFAGVVYLHQLRLSVGQIIRDLELIASVSEPEAMRNWIEYLPL